MKDPLGERMKRYEAVSQNRLVPRMPVVVRVDGKCFSNWVKKSGIHGFSYHLHDCFKMVCEKVLDSVQNCVLFYTQSDEATFVMVDYKNHETQPFYDNKVQKITSVISSLFTAYFNHFNSDQGYFVKNLAFFDCRAFNAPKEDLTNCILWRVRDAERNSINSYCQVFFGPKKLKDKNKEERLKMLDEIRSPWHNLSEAQKYGTMGDKNGMFNPKTSYEELNEQIKHTFEHVE